MRPADQALVEFLSTKVASTGTFSGRGMLLAGLADEASYHRSETSKLLDLELIVRRVSTDRVALAALVKNARQHVQPHEAADLDQLASAVWVKPAVPALELGTPHRFDLSSVIDACLPRIRKQRGLIGFTMCCPSDRLGAYLIDRVKDEMSSLGRPRARLINTVGGLKEVPGALAQIRKQLPSLAKQDVVCGVVVVDADATAALWHAAVAELTAPYENRLVLFVLCRDEATPPPGMFALPAPVFFEHHAEAWWREVLRVKGWSGARLREVLDACVRAGDDGRLDIDGVYDDLNDALELLKHHDHEEPFHDEWIQRLGAI